MIVNVSSKNRTLDNIAGAAIAKPVEPTAEELKVEFSADPEILQEEEPAKTNEQQRKSVASPEVNEEKKEEIKPIVPPEQKKEEQSHKQEEEARPIMPASAAKPQARDYTGFSEQEARYLKAMSGEAFDYAKKIFKEHKEMKQNGDAQFFQSPDAYTLDPIYKKQQEDAYYFNQEARHWQQQLVNISEGNEWIPITGWKQDGTPEFGTPQKPTKMAEEQVRMAMNQCFGHATAARNNMQQFAGNFQNRIKQDNEAIQAECAKRFGWCADPKLMESKIEVPGAGEQAIKDVHAQFTNLFPSYLRNTPGVNVAAHMWIALQIFGQKIRELEAKNTIEEHKKEEEAKAEPTSSAVPAQKGVVSSSDPSEFSLEGLPE